MSATVVLGVSRSGTTLLKAMLDAHSQLAIPSESYFLPQLWDRHGERPERDAFVEDLGRLERLREWGVDPEQVRARLPAMPTFAQAVQSIYLLYAESWNKQRFGDKTPLYMQHLDLLERLFPDARFVHLIRDGRDAALSFLSVPAGLMTEGWGHPQDAAGFACQWATEVASARELGARVGGQRYRELRYEALVADPEGELRAVCALAGLEYDPAMLDYVGQTDSARKAHQQRLNEPPRQNVRKWRTEMSESDRHAFEEVAGALLAELGYEVEIRGTARGKLAAYRLRTGAWRGVGVLVQRSPLWSRRHPPLE